MKQETIQSPSGYTTEIQTDEPVNWGAATRAGLIVGVIFFVVSRGIPWAGSGFITPTIMGRELIPVTENPWPLFFGVMLLHFILSVVYALVISPVVHRFASLKGLLAGGIVALVLYVVNYMVFIRMGIGIVSHSEAVPIITHLAFGLTTGGAYRGLARKSVLAQ